MGKEDIRGKQKKDSEAEDIFFNSAFQAQHLCFLFRVNFLSLS